MYSQLKPSPRGEMEIPEMVRMHAAKQHYQVVQVERTQWRAIGYPWDLIRFMEHYSPEVQDSREGSIEDGVTIKGTVSIAPDAVIKAGTYIEGTVVIGPGSHIGPNAYLRGSLSIGANAKIGASCEIKNSIIGDQSHIPHLSYIGDSVIGNQVNIGAGSITANLRHDKAAVKTMVKDHLVPTGRHKFGAIIGDNAKLGINTTIYPGRKIGTNMTTEPGATITTDVS
jgi:bifunctional UDP-N-acetylglucosamine pyrophosphorylase/glucosamine-1-phosphate N-acetyltransferase